MSDQPDPKSSEAAATNGKRSTVWSRWSVALVLLALVAGLAALVRFGPLTATGRRMIENAVSGQSIGQLGRLNLVGLRGDIWRDFSVERLTISDKDGVWLDARNLALRWDVSALLERRLHIRTVSAGVVSLSHRPTLGPPSEPSPQPVALDLDAVALRLEMLPAFAQVRGVYDIGAKLTLERNGVAKGRVRAASALHLGDFLDADFAIGSKGAFQIVADALEARGGAMAGAAGFAPDQTFSLTARASGDAHNGHFSVVSRSGSLTPLQASGVWNPAGGSASGRILLASSALLERFAKAAGPSADFRIDGRRGASGLYVLSLAMRSDNVMLDASGEGDLARRVLGAKGLAIKVTVADPSRIVSYPKMGAASLTGTLTGADRRWLFVGTGGVERPSDPSFSLARISGPLRVESRDGEYLVETTAKGEGGAGQGLIAALLGARPVATAKLTIFGDGRLLVRQLNVAGAGLNVTATGDRALLGGLSFKGEATVTNLAAARAGAGGQVKADWSASQGHGGEPWAFSFDAQGARFSTGIGMEVDRLLGVAPRLRAGGRVDAAGVEVAQATLDGAAGSANAAGVIGNDGGLKLALGWTVNGPAQVGPLTVGGAIKGTGSLAGTLTQPRADLAAEIATVDLPVLPLSNAHLLLGFADTGDGVGGHISVAATSQYGPAKGAADFRLIAAGIDLSSLELNGGGINASGSASLRAGQPSSADLAVAVGPGVLLSEGSANARVKIVAGAGEPQADITLQATDAVLVQGGEALKALKITARGPMNHLPYDLSANGAATQGRWRIAGNGLYSDAGADRAVTFAGGGRVGQVDFHTLAPVQIALGPEHTQAHVLLSVGTGKADVTLTTGGGALDAKATVSDISLSLLSQDYVGRFNANLALSGRGDSLSGLLDARLAGAGGRDLKGSPPVDGEIKARLGGGAVVVDATLGNSQGLKATSDLTLPVVATAAPFRIAVNTKRPMSGRFAIDGELKPIWDLLMGGDRSLGGHVVASGTLAGSLADPRLVGTAALDNGSFRDSGTGLKLNAITLRATMAKNAIDFSQFSASDTGRGQMSGGGEISLLRDGVSSLRLELKRFRLIDNDFAEASASGLVSVNRAADGHVKLSGDLTIDQAQVSPNSPVATGVVPMEVVEIHRPVDVGERFVAAPRGAAPVALDIRLHSSGGILVKGRGLNLELSLDAQVGGTTAAPQLTGSAHVVRGDYNFAGQRFMISDSGVVHLGATPETIRLDLTATRESPSLTAVIRIQGTAAKPTITLTSSPILPQDEVLSQVLFGASASQLSPLEAAQLASAVSGLATGGGFDVIGGLRNFAHLDRLAIGTSTPTLPTVVNGRVVPASALTGTTFAGGKYLTNNVYLEVIGGQEGYGVQVEWQVRKHLSVVSRAATQGDSQLSIRWRTDY